MYLCLEFECPDDRGVEGVTARLDAHERRGAAGHCFPAVLATSFACRGASNSRATPGTRRSRVVSRARARAADRPCAAKKWSRGASERLKAKPAPFLPFFELPCLVHVAVISTEAPRFVSKAVAGIAIVAAVRARAWRRGMSEWLSPPRSERTWLHFAVCLQAGARSCCICARPRVMNRFIGTTIGGNFSLADSVGNLCPCLPRDGCQMPLLSSRCPLSTPAITGLTERDPWRCRAALITHASRPCMLARVPLWDGCPWRLGKGPLCVRVASPKCG